MYAELGTEIIAVEKGVVTDVRYSDSYGNVVKYKLVDYNKNIEIFYAHMNEIFVNEGDELEKGDIVGTCGETGLATGPHLHYTIYVDGEEIDPISFVSMAITKELSEEI